MTSETPGSMGLGARTVADRETHPGTGAGVQPQADLRGLCRLPEGQAGTVVPLRVDVSEDGNKEGRWVPLRTQLPPAGLAKLWEGRVRGQLPLHPATEPEHSQGLDARFQSSR